MRSMLPFKTCTEVLNLLLTHYCRGHQGYNHEKNTFLALKNQSLLKLSKLAINIK